nr:hypothetical protein [Candidatus Njordarchaeum guaymaensis]
MSFSQLTPIARKAFHRLPKSLEKPARTAYRILRRKRRSTGARVVTQAEIVEGLTRLGVRPGDILFVHSSMSSIGRVPSGP